MHLRDWLNRCVFDLEGKLQIKTERARTINSAVRDQKSPLSAYLRITRDYGQRASRETMDREHHKRLWTESIMRDYGQTASRETMDLSLIHI